MVGRYYEGNKKMYDLSLKSWRNSKEYLPIGYQEIKCCMIFDIKLIENFRRKSRLVGGRHKTATPASITYSLLVSRDLVRITLAIS